MVDERFGALEAAIADLSASRQPSEDNVLDFDLPELQAKIETDPTHQPGTLGPRPVEIPAQPLQRGPSSRGGIETTDPRHQPGTLGPRPVETPA
ncbi:uncharacterized protein LOC144107492 isoform X2 [Amblyomma americanum]